MTDDIFLFDTYALLEILNKNTKYEEYTNKDIIINEFIFAEFCYKLFLEKIKNAKEYIDELTLAIIRPDNKIIEKAMQFRVQNKNKKMSMTDCISYIMAKELKIRFLTGDKEFEDLEDVEFIKK